MKTISELSGTVIRMAAAAIAEARRSLPTEEPPAASPPPAAPEVAAAPADAATEAAPDEAGTASAADEAAAPASTEAGTESAPPEAGAEAAPTEAAGGRAGAKPEPRRESEAEKAALDEAAAKATGFSGDRLTMLRTAVEVAGSRLKDVRLVRVFGAEEQLSGGRIVGEYQYVVDFHPTAMKQVAGSHKEERGGRGGGRGRGGGPGGGGRGAKGSTTGGFSMDSLRDDRKKEGGARGRPGGARRPGGPGRPPGGPPKK